MRSNNISENLQETYGSCWKLNNCCQTQLFQKKAGNLQDLLMSKNAHYWHRREASPRLSSLCCFRHTEDVLSSVFWKNMSQHTAEIELPNTQRSVTIWTPKKKWYYLTERQEDRGKLPCFLPMGLKGFKAVFIQGRWAPCFGPPQGTAPGNDKIKIPLHSFTHAHRGNM